MRFQVGEPILCEADKLLEDGQPWHLPPDAAIVWSSTNTSVLTVTPRPGTSDANGVGILAGYAGFHAEWTNALGQIRKATFPVVITDACNPAFPAYPQGFDIGLQLRCRLDAQIAGPPAPPPPPPPPLE